MLIVAQQLDELISYTSGRSNISKPLKQGLLKLRNSVAMAKKEYDLLIEERSEVDEHKKERFTQTDSFFFVGSATMTQEIRE